MEETYKIRPISDDIEVLARVKQLACSSNFGWENGCVVVKSDSFNNAVAAFNKELTHAGIHIDFDVDGDFFV